jgi:hypothetical protein
VLAVTRSARACARPDSATSWPVNATVSLAQTKQLCHVDKPADDRKSSLREAADSGYQRLG